MSKVLTIECIENAFDKTMYAVIPKRNINNTFSMTVKFCGLLIYTTNEYKSKLEAYKQAYDIFIG